MNIEKLTLRFMVALRDTPKNADQRSKKSAQEICEGLKFSNQEYQSVIAYAKHNKLIEINPTTDGFIRVRFGENANEWLSKNTESWSLDRRLVIWGIIMTVVLAVGAVVAQWLLPD